MILRWVFLFLLLANAISLFWYAQQEEVSAKQQAEQPGGQTIRLLSEMPEGSLVLRNDSQGAVDSLENAVCLLYRGFKEKPQAQEVENILQRQGAITRLSVTEQDEVIAYSLNVTISSQLTTRLQHLEVLAEEGLLKPEQMDEVGLDLIVGRYKDVADAEQQQQRLLAQGVTAELAPEYRNSNRYNVAVVRGIDRNLSNKINEVVKNSYSWIKIEKKVCEGVASLRSSG